MIVVREFDSENDGCKAKTHVEVAPFNPGMTIAITILQDGKKLDGLKIKGDVERNSLEGVEWFFKKYNLGCFMVVRNWWLNDAYPKIQEATIERNRTTTPTDRQRYKHLFRFS